MGWSNGRAVVTAGRSRAPRTAVAEEQLGVPLPRPVLDSLEQETADAATSVPSLDSQVVDVHRRATGAQFG